MKISANGIDLYYDLTGNGPHVTFLHSLSTDHSIWESQVKALQGSHTLLTCDLRGHGQSSAPAGGYTLELLADDVLALWDALGVDRSHVVGISLGGMVAQTLALKARRRVGSLVLADTTGYYPPAAAAAFTDRIRIVREQGIEPLVQPTLERWFTARFREVRPEVVERIAGLIRRTPAAGYIGCCHAIARLDTFSRLNEIRCPTLVIVGEEDQGTPPDMARALAEGIPGARLEIIAGAHLTCVEQADAFNKLLSDFLAELHRQQH
jgi:3-oxoadipate enol-lactonase